ncbi:hypothetical protein AMTRI_Chr04g250000 [Amborella trichopoda]
MDSNDHEEEEEEEISLPVHPRLKMGSNAEPPQKRTPLTANRYRECLKNHAVSMGGHAVDGCGEFMPAGEDGSLGALKCAACGCHRNFHRKESDGEIFRQYPHFYGGSVGGPAPYAAAAHRAAPLALPSSSGGHSRDDEDVSNVPGSGAGHSHGQGLGVIKKRFRTKFSQEQKDKMLAFAEKVGWRIQKQDEAEVQRFCAEACVKRHVLKVWMHNNKHTLVVLLDDGALLILGAESWESCFLERETMAFDVERGEREIVVLLLLALF